MSSKIGLIGCTKYAQKSPKICYLSYFWTNLKPISQLTYWFLFLDLPWSSLDWLDSAPKSSFPYKREYYPVSLLSLCDVIVLKKCTIEKDSNIPVGGVKISIALFLRKAKKMFIGRYTKYYSKKVYIIVDIYVFCLVV